MEINWHLLGLMLLFVFFYKTYKYCRKQMEIMYEREMCFSNLEVKFKNASVKEIEIWLWDGTHRGIHGRSKEAFRHDLQVFLNHKEAEEFSEEVVGRLRSYDFNFKNK